MKYRLYHNNLIYVKEYSYRNIIILKTFSDFVGHINEGHVSRVVTSKPILTVE